MKAVLVVTGATPTKVDAAGNRDFISIYNNGSVTVYLCFDCDDATALSTLDTNNGYPLKAGQSISLSNDGQRNVFNKPVYAVHGDAGSQELRVQGA